MHPDEIRLEAEGLLQQRELPAALMRFEELIRLAPDDSRGWKSYARALLSAKRQDSAIEAFERAAELDPQDSESRSSLAAVFQSRSQVEQAIHWHGEALARDPDSLVLRLNHACVWPVIATSVSQILECRARAEELLERLRRDPAVYLHPTHEASNHTFALAYHGVDDRLWLERYAQLVMRHVLGDGPQQPFPSAVAAPRGAGRSGRLRIGFMSAYFYGHSNTRAFEGLLRGLDRERFELVLIHLNGSLDDAVRQRLEAGADQVVHCGPDIALSWQRLQALRLDLLYITDVGMNPELYAMLCRKVAPVQVTGWGFPRTSGFPTIDYYLSGDLVEPANGQAHYCETLVRLAGLPCRYLSDDLPVNPLAVEIGRAYFMLPDGPPLVGCLQTFLKMHPDLDAVLERIAVEIPEALFVFVEPQSPGHAEAFLSRLHRSAPAAFERVVMVAGVNRADYSALAGCLDVLLDTPHFGSGISFYESIWTGTPMVTQEGAFLRSRYVAAGYRLMGMADELVAESPAAMTDLAISLLRDTPRREALRLRIREAARLHLYDRMDVVHSFEAFAIEAIERSRGNLG